MSETGPSGQPNPLESPSMQPPVEPVTPEHQGVFDDMLSQNTEQEPEGDGLLTAGDIVRGITKALAITGESDERRLERIQRRLDEGDLPSLPRVFVAKNERIMAKIAHRGNHNLEMGTTYGTGDDYDRSATLKEGSSQQRHHHKNSAKIEKLRAKLISEEEYQEPYRQRLVETRDELERKPGIVRKESTHQMNNVPLDNESARRLKEKSVKMPLHDAYTALLEHALVKDELDPSTLAATFGPLTPKNSRLATFTATRLVREGVVDKTGKVIMPKDQIKHLLTSGKLPAPEVTTPALDKQLAEDLFTKAETAVKKLVSLDTSSSPASKKYNEARTQVWREMSYMVEEELRSQFFVLFDQFLGKARSTYNATKEIIALRIAEDQSEDTPEEKYSKYHSEVWTEVVNIVPETERQRLLGLFEEFEQEDKERLSAAQQVSSKSQRQTPKKKSKDELEARLHELTENDD